ncbi:putative alpha-amylase [Talaromyces proteolyticus]|uniref:alpha-amylase n=1 Tax=Talaromyces proteolyticus TaxID=1131652 RepID=A0AAD4KD14_9EURO|nr:putative alpha-amylase [Talaromyces proteolyticus]KAH8689124.1 putative alpha-amylase [Talaromyces proteolyticus]
MVSCPLSFLAVAVAFIGGSNAASADEWAARSIYQVVTDRYAHSSTSSESCNITKYCGGTWKGLANNLDYIQDMGFTAVQISPVQQNIPQDTIYGEAYHGYWPQNLYALNDRFGTADDLHYLVSELHKREMYLMADVVANELAYDIGDKNMTVSTEIDYSVFVPFNQSSDFNTYCPIVDWNNKTECTTCWLGHQGVATPRIKTSDPEVAATLGRWIGDLVKTYDIDGIRVDGSKQIEPTFFPSFVHSAGVFAMGEVFDGTPEIVCGYQNLTSGLENYPLYGKIIDAFTAGKMDDLVTMVGAMRKTCSSPQYLVNFLENQDNTRFASYTKDLALAKNALSFTILSDGIPKVYYGQEQHLSGQYSPYNRQALWENSPSYDKSAVLYTLTATLNKLRNHAISMDSHYLTNWSSILYNDGSTYVTRKGANGAHIVAVLSNQGLHGGEYTLDVHGAADPGTNLTEVTNCNSTVVAGFNGTITIPMGQGQPRVYFPTFNLKGSGLCGQLSTLIAAPDASSTAQPSTTSTFLTQQGRGARFQISGWSGVFAVMVFALT